MRRMKNRVPSSTARISWPRSSPTLEILRAIWPPFEQSKLRSEVKILSGTHLTRYCSTLGLLSDSLNLRGSISRVSSDINGRHHLGTKTKKRAHSSMPAERTRGHLATGSYGVRY